MAEPDAGWETFTEKLENFGIYDDIKAICDRNGALLREVYSRQRTAQVAEARHEICLYLREVMGWSYPTIGLLLRRDHTTIMASCDAAKQRREERKRR